MSRIYTKEEIDVLISDYKKKPTEELAEQLLKAFEWFILKYAHFLKYRYVKSYPEDKDIHGLMSILNIKEIHNNPILAMFDTWDFSDIFNELYMLFMQSIVQFTRRKDGPYFTGYLYTYYKFMIKKWICQLSKDAMNSVNVMSIDDHENLEDSKEIHPQYKNICLTELTELSPDERMILFYSYQKKMTKREISELLGYGKTHIDDLRQRAKKKIIASGFILDDFEREI